jgi:hypothetical protein
VNRCVPRHTERQPGGATFRVITSHPPPEQPGDSRDRTPTVSEPRTRRVRILVDGKPRVEILDRPLRQWQWQWLRQWQWLAVGGSGSGSDKCVWGGGGLRAQGVIVPPVKRWREQPRAKAGPEKQQGRGASEGAAEG